MKELRINVGIDAWIIQDGNYNDFSVGQQTKFAMEFYPHAVKPSGLRERSLRPKSANCYHVCGQVVYANETVWVLDIGFLVYQEGRLPRYAKKGAWIEGEIYLGIDPFMYFEHLKDLPDMPPLVYQFGVEKIFLETTPWLTTADELGRTMLLRDAAKKSYQAVAKTDAWNDDDEHAHYILECIFI